MTKEIKNYYRYMFKKIKDCKESIKMGWSVKKENGEELILENPDFGRVEIVANTIGNYDQLAYIQPTGSVVVVLIDEKREKIYLHTEERPAAPKENCPEIKKGNLYIPFDHLGRGSIETIRGFSEGTWQNTAITEIKDEAGLEIRENDLEQLGIINANTAFFCFNVVAVLAKGDSKIKFSPQSEGDKKKIKNRKWYTKKEVKEIIAQGKIFCGVTLATLNLYFQKSEVN
ncbi:MAG: hypothetical protein Q8N16_03375 [bacterium]|nr:hypothetical protein [bacterium]